MLSTRHQFSRLETSARPIQSRSRPPAASRRTSGPRRDRAPEQARVLTARSEKSDAFADEVFSKLKAAGIRATLDNSPDKIGAKIRLAQIDRIPYMLVIGEKKPPAPASPSATPKKATKA